MNVFKQPMKIPMVDLKGQYQKIKPEIDAAIREVIDQTAFINGPQVKSFASHIAAYNGSDYVVTCGNGTDALQIALMALDLHRGDEVIVPAFTYVATAEVIGLLGLTPVMVDVDYDNFNISLKHLSLALSEKTKAIVPVHLFGQCSPMEPLLSFAKKNHLYVVEDNAQAIGAVYTFSDGRRVKTGALGDIGCTSFFPTKNLGCYGDGGAMFTNDAKLAERLRMIASHGQVEKYHHQIIGCNSRLDTLQAAILDVKLKHLDEYCKARQAAARYYDSELMSVKGIILPVEESYSTHVYNQYTIKVPDGRRDALRQFLADGGLPGMVYYPLPLQEQEAFKGIARAAGSLTNAELLARSVLSLPIHSEITRRDQDLVISRIKEFFI